MEDQVVDRDKECSVSNTEQNQIEKVEENLPISLSEETLEIAEKIKKAKDQQELKDLSGLFKLNQAKINALKVMKLNGLLDKVEDQAIERFEKNPNEVSNEELLKYMQVVASQIDRSQRIMDDIEEKPIVQINNQRNEVNVQIGDNLSQDSKENVVKAIQELFKSLNEENKGDNN